jgi:hypothetical protein
MLLPLSGNCSLSCTSQPSLLLISAAGCT